MTNITLLIITVAAGLITAWVIWYAGKRRLYIVVPKLFAHSNLAATGRTIELTILNRGYRSEENVRIELDPNLSYEQIASTDPATQLSGSTILVERIPGGDEVTVLVLAEKGQFGKTSIAKISSKECKGVVVEKIENVPLAVGSMVGGLLGAVMIMTFFMGLGWFAHEVVKTDVFLESANSVEVPVPGELEALGWRNMASFVNSKVYKNSTTKEFPIEITDVNKVGEVVTVKFRIRNDTQERLSVTGKLISPVEKFDAKIKFGDHFFHDALVFPGKSVERTLKINLPRSADPQMVVANFNIRDVGSDIFYSVHNLEKDIEFNTE